MMHALKTRSALFLVAAAILLGHPAARAAEGGVAYPIVDTGQDRCFSDSAEIPFPAPGQPYFGQDAEFAGNAPAYRDNGDGTVSDLVTGLVWQKAPDPAKRTQDEAEAYAAALTLGGHDDWRLPTIKELFSITDFRGNMRTRTPYLDTRAFDFTYPQSDFNESGPPGQRAMDAQYASSTRYLGTTMRGDASAFGFNFADGRIKSYPLFAKRYVRCVRGPAYGMNDFRDNGDGTVTDRATGLTWTQAAAAKPMAWREALAYAAALRLASRDDWRLPNVKELQSLVDYGRAPDAADPARRAPAIDPVFKLARPEAWCWSSTTHIENGFAYYVCFGMGLSAWTWRDRPMNAHGAGAVRSDPKSGDPARWAEGHGPQGDQIRILNDVLCVRGGRAELKTTSSLPLLPASANMMPRPGQGGPAMRGAQAPPGERFIRRLDRDGDGKVSRAEFDGPPRDFGRLDRDGDGYLSAAEAPPPPPFARGRN